MIFKSLPMMSESVSFFLGAHIMIPLWVTLAVTFVLLDRARWIWMTCALSLVVATCTLWI